MAVLATWVLVWLAACGIGCSADESFAVSISRNAHDPTLMNAVSAHRKRQTGDFPAARLPLLYWSGNFTFGDSVATVTIDTGSTDIILDPKVYKPSKNSKKYGNGTFESGYEGVNRNGFGFLQINGTLVSDVVSMGNLSVPHQAIGSITKYLFTDTKPVPGVLPADGVMGFAAKSGSAFVPQAAPWFQSLCIDKAIDECKFGLAFGTNGTGQLVVGTTKSSLISGAFQTVKKEDSLGATYLLQGDVVLDGKTLFENQSFIMDVGTNNLQSPIPQAKTIFKKLGWDTHVLAGKGSGQAATKDLEAYFACDKPPVLGFSFPTKSQLKKGQLSTVFNVSQAADIWAVEKRKNGNCTSILGGTTFLDNGNFGPVDNVWLVGQSFFSGHYLEFDHTANTISIANLKDPAGAS